MWQTLAGQEQSIELRYTREILHVLWSEYQNCNDCQGWKGVLSAKLKYLCYSILPLSCQYPPLRDNDKLLVITLSTLIYTVILFSFLLWTASQVLFIGGLSHQLFMSAYSLFFSVYWGFQFHVTAIVHCGHKQHKEMHNFMDKDKLPQHITWAY